MSTTQNKRLGRGLGSLISGGVQASPANKSSSVAKSRASKSAVGNGRTSASNTNQESRSDGEFKEIALGKSVPNPFQPREHFDESSITDLVASIKSEGLLQPIVVRDVDGQFELVAGERRFRAMRKLKKRSITARILKISDLSSAALSLIENLQRADLNPVEEARGYETLMREFGLTQEKASTRVGKSRAYVANALRLLHLDPSIQELLASGKLSVGHAKALLGLSSDSERNSLAKRIVAEGLSVRDAENEVKILKGEDLQLAARVAVPAESTSAYPKPQAVVQHEKILGEKLSTHVEFKHGARGRGKIVIDYNDLEDLQRVMGLLT